MTLIIIALAVYGAFLARAAATPDYSSVLQPPSAVHWLGTDEFGRDELVRILYGAHLSIVIGLGSVLASMIPGVLLGVVAGYYEGSVATIIMRATDVMLSFPGILVAIGVIAIFGGGLINVIFAVAVFTLPVFIRLVHGSTLAQRHLSYVEAARMIGASDVRILLRRIIPNIYPVILIYATMRIGTAILTAASLSFLGLGVDPSTPEWGAMLNQAQNFLSSAPWTLIGPGLAIVVTVLCFNMLGEALREAVDPRIRL